MLTRLHIRNYAIISELDVQIEPGLTIITGETGAGKSILIGALSLVLGKRADTSVLFDAKEKCVVEATFDMAGLEFQEFFRTNDLDFEPTTILRREINANGKSRAFINDTPVNLNQLKELALALIDIHSQHEVLSLKTSEFRARFIDACADGGKSFELYSSLYSNWSELLKELEALKKDAQAANAEEDYLQFQLNELQELNISEGELESAQTRLSLLENAEEIRSSLAQLSEEISDSEHSLVDRLRSLESQLSQLARKFPAAKDWSDRLRSSLIDIEDIAQEIDRSSQQVDEDPEDLLRLQFRVDEILRLITKHRRRSETELLQFQAELMERLDRISSSDEKITLKNAELEKLEQELNSSANALSETRKSAADRVSPVIESHLQNLGLEGAKFTIRIEPTERNVLGQDRLEIMFSANKGQSVQDITKVASGGELSRLMLAVKSEMAKTSKLPSIIFDEIDTGVSGEVANKVGISIKDLSSRMQVLCITHLPQIASKADQHLLVYKDVVNGKTETRLKELSKPDRIVEIAKMLSNTKPTETALAHAKNLIEESPSAN